MQRKPEGLDWERWLGRGPKVAWDPNIYFSPYKWLHYDGGMIMGIGIHVVDSAHHWLGLTRPAAAVASGGTFHFNDGRDTPDVISFSLEYPEKLIVTFLAECLTCKGVKTSAGVELRGIGGLLWAERYVQDTAWQYTPNTTNTQEPVAKGPGKGATAAYNLRNWVECIRSRQRSVCNEEVAYYSTMACFMAAQAYKTKSRVVWDKTWDLPS
jgi:predicted dehydrogenase